MTCDIISLVIDSVVFVKLFNFTWSCLFSHVEKTPTRERRPEDANAGRAGGKLAGGLLVANMPLVSSSFILYLTRLFMVKQQKRWYGKLIKTSVLYRNLMI